jgi:hypothetical protein
VTPDDDLAEIEDHAAGDAQDKLLLLVSSANFTPGIDFDLWRRCLGGAARRALSRLCVAFLF